MARRSTSRKATSAPPPAGLTKKAAATVTAGLQDRLNALTDLALTLKHIHWNVVGPQFIAVHEMLDPQYEAVSAMIDATAERISILGGVPIGTPGALVASRHWDDYDIGRAPAIAHLGALHLVYEGVIKDHRALMDAIADIDPVTQDLVIGQLDELEKFSWFVRAHLENSDGSLVIGDATTEATAAKRAAAR